MGPSPPQSGVWQSPVPAGQPGGGFLFSFLCFKKSLSVQLHMPETQSCCILWTFTKVL